MKTKLYKRGWQNYKKTKNNINNTPYVLFIKLKKGDKDSDFAQLSLNSVKLYY